MAGPATSEPRGWRMVGGQGGRVMTWRGVAWGDVARRGEAWRGVAGRLVRIARRAGMERLEGRLALTLDGGTRLAAGSARAARR